MKAAIQGLGIFLLVQFLMNQFMSGKKEDNYDLQLLTDARYAARQASIHENPYFFNAPFSGIVGK